MVVDSILAGARGRTGGLHRGAPLEAQRRATVDEGGDEAARYRQGLEFGRGAPPVIWPMVPSPAPLLPVTR